MLSYWSCRMSLLGYVLLLTAALCCSAAPAPDEIVCSAYTDVPNGKLVVEKPSYKYEEEIEVKCDYGFMLQMEQSKPKCTSNGWSPPPVCVSKKCNRPDIKHGILYSNYYYFPVTIGRYVEYRCEKDYVSHARTYWARIYCTDLGWDPEPKCSRECLKRKAYVANAELKDEQYMYLEGEKVKFQCKYSFLTPDGKTHGEITCLPDGEFTPATCSKTCEAPELPNGKFRPIKNVFDIGETLQYECNKGFMTENRKLSSSARCHKEGWSEEPSCIPVTCRHDGVSYNDGDVITYTCPHGQRPESELGQCYHSGFYPPRKCLEKKPEATHPPTDKKPETKCSISDDANLLRKPFKVQYRGGDEVSLVCEEGFIKEGPSKTTCTANGWNPPLPTCEKRQKCPLPYNPIHAEITDPKEEYYNSDSVTMTCERGYKMNGSPVIRCIEGKWEQPPECIKVTPCRNPPRINNGDISESSKQESYVTDDIVTFSCKPGYHLNGPEETTCVNGQWTALPTCTENPCDAPPEVSHATVVEKKESFNHGESAKYECENGFRFPGKKSASCIKGRWTSTPTCVATSCTPPPRVKDSRIDGEIKDTYASGEKITYVCNPGFTLERSGTGEALCEDTHWKNVPVCRRIGAQCGPPPVVQYGDTISFTKPLYNSGESVEYKCPEYYSLQGNRIVRCLNGAWDEAPVCLEPCTAKEKDMKDNNIRLRYKSDAKLYNKHGDSMEFICLSGYEAPPGTQMRITCEHGKLQYPKCFKTGFCVLDEPTMITHNIHYTASTIVDNGQTITFQCNEEMIPEDNLEAKCESGKINYPKCTERIGAQCGPPPVVQYGDTISFNKPFYNSGESVEYKCPEYFLLKGKKIVRCLNGVWDEAPVCLEPCTTKEKDMEDNKIRQKDGPNGKFYNKHGDTIEFDCVSGYEAPPGSQMRITCEQGKLQYPKCFKTGFCVLDEPTMITHNIHYTASTIVDNGQTITFQCHEEMIPENKLEAKCEARRINYPKCSIASPCKISTEDLNLYNIQLIPSDDPEKILDITHRHGTQLNVTCKSGFRQPTQEALVIKCYDGEFRCPRCFAGSTCRIDQDELHRNNLELDEVHNNEVFYEENERVLFTCKTGYYRRTKPIGKCSKETLIYPSCTAQSSG